MSSVFLLILAFAALLTRKFKLRLVAKMFFILSLVWFIGVGCGFLPGIVSTQLQRQDRLWSPLFKSNNAIVVLGAGSVWWPQSQEYASNVFGYSRIHEAARLYGLCKKAERVCRILVTGGDPRRTGSSEAQILSTELMQIGIPEKDLILEGRSKNTFQNAQFTAEILATQKMDQVILVTSGLHVKRASLYFSRFLDPFLVSSADRMMPVYSLIPTGYNFTVMDLALHEIVGIARFKVYNLLGLNPKVTPIKL